MDDRKLAQNERFRDGFFYFGFPKQVEKTVSEAISVGDCQVECSKSIKLLGFTLDSGLTCNEHIKNKCSSAITNINRIIKLSRYIIGIRKILAAALVLSHFDYGNALLTGLPASTIRPMQLLQNYAAKIVTKRRIIFATCYI